jgi:hypothetical protein
MNGLPNSHGGVVAGCNEPQRLLLFRFKEWYDKGTALHDQRKSDIYSLRNNGLYDTSFSCSQLNVHDLLREFFERSLKLSMVIKLIDPFVAVKYIVFKLKNISYWSETIRWALLRRR